MYFLSVREHIGGEELAAEMAKAAQRQGRRVVVHPRARADDLKGAPESAAAIILFTYADRDLAAAGALLRNLPENDCGVIPVAAQTPVTAPFLQALRERARDMLSPGSPADFIEIANTALADSEQFAPALQKLGDIIFAQEEEQRRKVEEEKAAAEAKAKAEAEQQQTAAAEAEAEQQKIEAAQQAAQAEAEAQAEADAQAEAEAEVKALQEKPTLLSLAAHLGFPLDELWAKALAKTPDSGVSDPFTAPPAQLRREINALLRKDFEAHKTDTKVHTNSIRHPRNARYDIIVFAFAILCHRMHEDESSGEQVMYDELHLFDRGSESPLFPLFTLCWIFAAEDMIAHGKSGDAKNRLESIVRSFRKPRKGEGEDKNKTDAKGKNKKNKPAAQVPPILRVMALRAVFYVSQDDEARKKIADDLNRATQLLSEDDRQIINARARAFAAVNKAREEIKDLL